MKKILILALALLVAGTTSAQAKPGALDRSFGERGKVVRSQPLESQAWDLAPTAIAKLPEGRMIVLAGRSLLAFRPDGRPARRFGGGVVNVVAPPESSLQLVDVAVDGQGRVIVGGTAQGPGAPPDEDVFLARFTPSGALDPAFGEGGVLLTDLDAPAPEVIPPVGTPLWDYRPMTRLMGIAIDARGKIVLSGVGIDKIGPCRGFGEWRFYDVFAARLSEEGNLDPSFGQNGATWFRELEGAGPPVLTRSGSVYLSTLGIQQCSPPGASYLLHLDPMGNADPNFGAGGLVPLDEPYPAKGAIALDRHQKVLLLTQREVRGRETQQGRTIGWVRRFLPTGELDSSFGRNGSAALPAGGSAGFKASAIAAEPSGRIVVAGTLWPLGPSGKPRSFMVGRLTPNGTIDRRFGGDGRMETRFGRRSQVKAAGLAIVSRGRLLVAGTISRPSLSAGEGLALARYLSR